VGKTNDHTWGIPVILDNRYRLNSELIERFSDWEPGQASERHQQITGVGVAAEGPPDLGAQRGNHGAHRGQPFNG
jgi:hypothetical protein